MQADAIVFIGRFQPFHKAHEDIVKKALELTNNLIIVIGSAFEPRTEKNPFTVKEREEMILGSDVFLNYYDNITIVSTYDTIYNNESWASRVQQLVKENTNEGDNISIIGHKKDETSFYLDMFPQWDVIEVPLFDNISATDIRNILFQDISLRYIQSVVPSSTYEFLLSFKETIDYQNLIEEIETNNHYKKQYASYPYPPTFVTVDAVTVQSGHILMVKRRSRPGKGLWALPGGFLDANSDVSLKHAVVRELKEETCLKVPEKIIIGSIINNNVFDAISRSSRGRTITHAYYIRLDDSHPLPKVKGESDAEKAQWIPFSDVKKSECFEDHWEIIHSLTGLTCSL